MTTNQLRMRKKVKTNSLTVAIENKVGGSRHDNDTISLRGGGSTKQQTIAGYSYSSRAPRGPLELPFEEASREDPTVFLINYCYLQSLSIIVISTCYFSQGNN